jgi:N-acetylneuraminate synthase/N,N'-diacetyllegionaminate synthase
VIAEAGVNHNGDVTLAHRLVEAAHQAGADAVKFQTFSADMLATASAAKAGYQRAATGAGSQLDMLRSLELRPVDFENLRDHCRDLGLEFLSSAFDDASVDLLHDLRVAAFKVPSGELTNTPLLRHIASKGRPVILSTGMATMDEIRLAIGVLESSGADNIVILHCVSAYPPMDSDINLRAMRTLADAFRRPVGFSDHSLGTAVAIGACALSAHMIEKHLTLDRNLSGPDHRASLNPAEFTEMVSAIRRVEAALGDGCKVPKEAEREIARVVRKSLHARTDLPAGAVIACDSVIITRPETGLPPSMFEHIVGRILRRAVPAGQPICLDDLAETHAGRMKT